MAKGWKICMNQINNLGWRRKRQIASKIGRWQAVAVPLCRIWKTCEKRALYYIDCIFRKYGIAKIGDTCCILRSRLNNMSAWPQTRFQCCIKNTSVLLLLFSANFCCLKQMTHPTTSYIFPSGKKELQLNICKWKTMLQWTTICTIFWGHHHSVFRSIVILLGTVQIGNYHRGTKNLWWPGKKDDRYEPGLRGQKNNHLIQHEAGRNTPSTTLFWKLNSSESNALAQ